MLESAQKNQNLVSNMTNENFTPSEENGTFIHWDGKGGMALKALYDIDKEVLQIQDFYPTNVSNRINEKNENCEEKMERHRITLYGLDYAYDWTTRKK